MIRIVAMLLAAWALTPSLLSQVTTLYSMGNPTDEEQLYVELINRARANPTAEGIFLANTTDPSVLNGYDSFHVDLELMQEEFAAIQPMPPLALNAKLTQMARGHTQDMFDHAFQGHVSSNYDTLGDRVAAVSYNFSAVAENVFSYATSVFHGHAGFEVDWGDGGTGGMQPGRGHRANIHGSYREVGVGVKLGTNTVDEETVGPQLVTQNFGSQSGSLAYVTGVAFYDMNGNDFYDPGEGIGGLTVNVSGSSFHAVTTTSGGYAVPVPTANANRTVSFTGLAANHSADAVIANQANVKVDFKPTYVAPIPSGPAQAYVAAATSFNFPAVLGATSYEFQALKAVAAANDPADNLTRVTRSTSAGYTPRSTSIKNTGSAAYWLTHPAVAYTSEVLTYNESFMVRPGAKLSFRSRLRIATTNQVAKVQVSPNGGQSWEDVYHQSGATIDDENVHQGESSFQLRHVSLAAYEGQQILIRFNYDIGGGLLFPGTQDYLGWYIDDVVFTGLMDASDAEVRAVGGGQTQFDFVADEPGDYLISVRPMISGKAWPFGPPASIAVTENTPGFVPDQGMDELIVGGEFYHKILLEETETMGLTFSAKNLPSGLKIDKNTGEITGTPKKAESRTVTLLVKNKSGTTDMTLTMTVKPFPENLDGTYVGLVDRHAEIFGAVGGRLDMKITSLGAYSGSLTMGKTKMSFKGALDIVADGSALPHGRATIKPPGKPVQADIIVEFDVDHTHHRLANATATQAAASGVVSGWRQKWNTKDQQAVPYFGLHTFGLRLPAAGGLVNDIDVPQGWGYGSFTPGKDGKVNLVGMTPEGQKITCASFVGPQGEVLLYQALYATAPKGSLMGVLTIDVGNEADLTDTEDNTLSGALSWTRPADSSPKMRIYKDGFGLAGTAVETSVTLEATGARYLPPVGVNAVILGLQAGTQNARVEFDFGGIETVSDNPDQILDIGLKSKITSSDPAANLAGPKLKLTANVKTGLLTGSISLEDNDPRPEVTKPVKRSVKLQGLLIQDEGTHLGVGYFLLPELPTAEVPVNTRILSGKMTLRRNGP